MAVGEFREQEANAEEGARAEAALRAAAGLPHQLHAAGGQRHPGGTAEPRGGVVRPVPAGAVRGAEGDAVRHRRGHGGRAGLRRGGREGVLQPLGGGHPRPVGGDPGHHFPTDRQQRPGLRRRGRHCGARLHPHLADPGAGDRRGGDPGEGAGGGAPGLRPGDLERHRPEIPGHRAAVRLRGLVDRAGLHGAEPHAERLREGHHHHPAVGPGPHEGAEPLLRRHALLRHVAPQGPPAHPGQPDAGRPDLPPRRELHHPLPDGDEVGPGPVGGPPGPADRAPELRPVRGRGPAPHPRVGAGGHPDGVGRPDGDDAEGPAEPGRRDGAVGGGERVPGVVGNDGGDDESVLRLPGRGAGLHRRVHEGRRRPPGEGGGRPHGRIEGCGHRRAVRGAGGPGWRRRGRQGQDRPVPNRDRQRDGQGAGAAGAPGALRERAARQDGERAGRVQDGPRLPRGPVGGHLPVDCLHGQDWRDQRPG